MLQDVGNDLEDTKEIVVEEINAADNVTNEVGLDQEGLDQGGGGMDESSLVYVSITTEKIIPEERIIHVNTIRRPS